MISYATLINSFSKLFLGRPFPDISNLVKIYPCKFHLEIVLKNKVFIVTGATKGMGYAISERLLHEGAKVVLVYRSDEKNAEECSKKLQKYKRDFILVQADVSDLRQHRSIIEKALNKFSVIHALVNNAGVAPRSGFLKMDEEEYDRVLATNLKGPIFLAQAVAQQMIEQKTSGSIINIGSTSAYRPDSVVSYGPAKWQWSRRVRRWPLSLAPMAYESTQSVLVLI